MEILEKIEEYLEEVDLSKAKAAKPGEVFYANGGIYVGKFKGKKIYVAPEKYETKGTHKKAKNYCDKFSIKGLETNLTYKWRLPTYQEMEFIASTGLGNFKKDWDDYYWCSNQEGIGIYYKMFRFKDKNVSTDEQKNMRLIRPICSGS